MEIVRELGIIGLLLVLALVAIYVTYGLARRRHPANDVAKVPVSRPQVQNPQANEELVS